MSGWLIIEDGPNQGASFNLRQTVLTIGRSPANLVQVNHKSVSRRHAQLRKNDDFYLVMDLKSSNGTFLNGKLVTEPTPLKHRDLLQVGEVIFRFKARTIHGNLKDLVMERKIASNTSRFSRTEIYDPNQPDQAGFIEKDIPKKD